MEEKPLLSLIIPLYDDAERIWPFIEATRKALEGVDYELIFVDDASSDLTAHVLHLARQQFPEVQAIRHKKRAGLAATFLSGASKARADWLATLGVEDDPNHVLTLFKALYATDDGRIKLVLGWRPTWKRKLFGRPGRLNLIEREVFLNLPRIETLPLFLPELVALEGWQTVVVPLATVIYLREKWPPIPVGLSDWIALKWLKRRWLATSQRKREEVV